MMRRLAYVLLVIAAATPARPVSANCGDAGCYCLQSTMTCRGQGGTALPSISAAVTTVSITKYQIATLASNSFAGQQQLTWLSLDINGIKTIEPNAFAGLPALQYLSMASNSIDQMPERVFQNVSQLRALYIGYNGIGQVTAEVFIGLGSLSELDLSNNFLSALPSAALRYLVSLEKLDLSYNRLVSLPSDAFAGLARLGELSLDNNRLVSLPADGLFAGSPQLRTLDLSYNRLTQVSAGLFANLTTLVALNLTAAAMPCDCSAIAFRSWLDSPPAAQVKADWVANPLRSCSCSSPPSLQGTAVINVPAVAFVCTTTAPPPSPTAAPSSGSASAATPPSTPASSGAASASAATAAGLPTTAAALAERDSTTPAVLTSIGGSTLAIILGCSIGATALLTVILVTWGVRRHVLRQRARRSPKAELEPAGEKPAPVADAGVKNGQAAGGGGGGWLNGGYCSSPSTESVDSDNRAGQSARSPQKGDSDRPSRPAPADARPPAPGYYERIAADLQQGSASAARSPLKMNGLLPYAYTRQNSGRTPTSGSARAKTRLQLGTAKLDDTDANASLRFYSSHGALSLPASADGGGGGSPSAADQGRLYRSMRAPARTLSDRNAPLTSSLRLAGGSLSVARAVAARSDADLASAAEGAASPPRPALPSRALSEQGLHDQVEFSATSARHPFAAAGAAPAPDEMLQAPGSTRSAGWLASGSPQFAFPPQQYFLPPPADYSTLGSSRSLSAASGSLASGGGGGGGGGGSGPHLADRVRFINDTPV